MTSLKLLIIGSILLLLASFASCTMWMDGEDALSTIRQFRQHNPGGASALNPMLAMAANDKANVYSWLFVLTFLPGVALAIVAIAVHKQTRRSAAASLDNKNADNNRRGSK